MKPMTTPLDVEIVAFIEAQHDLRPKTKLEYERSLRRFDTYLGFGMLRDLEPKNVNAYITAKVEAGHKYVARNDMATLKVFAKWLVQAKHLRENPLVSISVPKVPQTGRPPFIEKELSQILKAASESRYPAIQSRDHLIVLLALWTGLRLNELRNLQWPADIADGMLRVRASKTDAGIREVPLDGFISTQIAAHVRTFRAWGEQPGPLFLTVNGEPFTYHGFARVQGRIRQRLAGTGVDYKIHRLRNTWARTMRGLNVDVLHIQQMGGWSDLSMVARYAGKAPSSELKRLPSMAAAFGRIA